MNLFTVPTLTLQLLYCFFVIEHEWRRILHLNVSRHPSSARVVQQLREAFPEADPYRYMILGHDVKCNAEVLAFLQALVMKPKRTSMPAPWQNGLAERWVGSIRCELLDQLIPFNKQHLRRLLRGYVNDHHEGRIHDSLQGIHHRQPFEVLPSPMATVTSEARL